VLDQDIVSDLPPYIFGVIQPPVLGGSVINPSTRAAESGTYYIVEYQSDDLLGRVKEIEACFVDAIECVSNAEILSERMRKLEECLLRLEVTVSIHSPSPPPSPFTILSPSVEITFKDKAGITQTSSFLWNPEPGNEGPFVFYPDYGASLVSVAFSDSADTTAGYSLSATSLLMCPPATLTAIPAVPTGLSVSEGDTVVGLAWNSVAGASGYKIYQAVGSGSPTEIADVNTTAYSHTGLTNGNTYTYTISAYNIIGESARSVGVNATPVDAIPATPSGLSATPGDTTASINWSDVAGAIGYRLYRAVGNATPIEIADVFVSNFSDNGLTNDTTYTYTVSAYNGTGESAQSAGVNTTPISAAPPVTPTGLSATAGNTLVSLNWNDVSLATGYKVYRYIGAGTPTEIADVGVSNYINIGLTNGPTYTFKVTAYNANGESAQSAGVNATPTAPPVIPPSYYGKNSTGVAPNESAILAGTSVPGEVTTEFTATLSTSPSEYGWFAVPNVADFTTWYVNIINNGAIGPLEFIDKVGAVTVSGTVYDLYMFNYPSEALDPITLA
jgi:fibronectin type 3 domain-containing protein